MKRMTKFLDDPQAHGIYTARIEVPWTSWDDIVADTRAGLPVLNKPAGGLSNRSQLIRALAERLYPHRPARSQRYALLSAASQTKEPHILLRNHLSIPFAAGFGEVFYSRKQWWKSIRDYCFPDDVAPIKALMAGLGNSLISNRSFRATIADLWTAGLLEAFRDTKGSTAGFMVGALPPALPAAQWIFVETSQLHFTEQREPAIDVTVYSLSELGVKLAEDFIAGYIPECSKLFGPDLNSTSKVTDPVLPPMLAFWARTLAGRRRFPAYIREMIASISEAFERGEWLATVVLSAVLAEHSLVDLYEETSGKTAPNESLGTVLSATRTLFNSAKDGSLKKADPWFATLNRFRIDTVHRSAYSVGEPEARQARLAAFRISLSVYPRLLQVGRAIKEQRKKAKRRKQ